MKSNTPLIADQIVACVSSARAPTLFELTEVAARIWTEGARDRSRVLWDRLTTDANERHVALRAAQLALAGG